MSAFLCSVSDEEEFRSIAKPYSGNRSSDINQYPYTTAKFQRVLYDLLFQKKKTFMIKYRLYITFSEILKHCNQIKSSSLAEEIEQQLQDTVCRNLKL